MIAALLHMLFLFVSALVCLLAAWILWHRWHYAAPTRSNCNSNVTTERVIAFFHPYCSSGGGGERVLWAIIQALGEINEQGLEKIKVIIYTVDPPCENYKTTLLKNVKDRFSLSIPSSLQISFIHLHDCVHYLDRASYLSLLLESWGTMRLAYTALKRSWQQQQQQQQQSFPPNLFFDTTGCAFTYLVASLLFGCKVIAYVHYPTISTDMLSMVWERRRATYNHQANIANSRIKTYIKLVYYTIFAIAYGTVGSLCSLVLVNSTWTYNHIHSLWWLAALQKRIHIVFPPCRISNNNNQTQQQQHRKRIVLSIGQFRPEKDHELQIESLKILLEKHPALKGGDVKMVMVGGCRNADDEERLRHLKEMTKELQLESAVDFIVNQPYSVVENWLHQASVGIHTMWNEHFGIGVVEMMSAGLLTIAHNSGGPKSDIVTPSSLEGKPTGLLASTAEEYADAMSQAFTMDEKEVSEMRKNARLSVARFSDEEFNSSFKREILNSKLLNQ